MNKQEIIEELKQWEEVTLATEDLWIEIARGDSFVGGSSDGFICDYLGNIQYSDEESIVNALFESLEQSEIEELEFA